MPCSSEARTQFAKKLEAFAHPLNHEEQSMFREILDRGGMTKVEIAGVHPGKINQNSLASLAPKLDASLFCRLLDW